MRGVDVSESPVDPADQIAIGNVADEQIKRIGGLVEPTVPQVVARHWALVDAVWLGAGPASLVVPATIVMPVALQLRAGSAVTEFSLDVAPPRPAVPLHVAGGDAV